MSEFEILPAISTFFIALSATLVAVGWRQIIKKKRDAHQKTMLWAAITAIIFFLIYASRTIFVGNTTWGGPEGLKSIYLIFLFFHIILATVAAVFGITTLVLGYRQKFNKHRKLGRVTAIVWFITAITGITVYILLYLLYPGGHTEPFIDALFRQ